MAHVQSLAQELLHATGAKKKKKKVDELENSETFKLESLYLNIRIYKKLGKLFTS